MADSTASCNVSLATLSFPEYSSRKEASLQQKADGDARTGLKQRVLRLTLLGTGAGHTPDCSPNVSQPLCALLPTVKGR